jgi:hypothetical protein
MTDQNIKLGFEIKITEQFSQGRLKLCYSINIVRT